MKWYVAPKDQGQIIEVAYAAGDSVVYRRCIDQSYPDGHPKRVSYARADAGEDDQGDYWNAPPPYRPEDQWEVIAEEEVEE